MKFPLKIAFCIRPDYLLRAGGDTIQLLKTKEYLEKYYDIKGDIITDPDKIDCIYDVCHIFNIATTKVTYNFIKVCQEKKVPKAISTILWDFSDVMTCDKLVKMNIYNLSRFNVNVAKAIFKITAKIINKPYIMSKAYRHYLTIVLNDVDHILPNSLEELYCLANVAQMDYGYLAGKSTIVCNGIIPTREVTISNVDLENKYAYLPPKYVLEVARIEPGKNQLNLLRALEKDNNLPILLIGSQEVFPKYYNKIAQIAQRRGNVYFIEQVAHNHLAYFYQNALVHVLPSYAETTGLVSIEALVNGCRAVVSNKKHCPYETYFKNLASYVDPFNINSIRNAIFSEINTKRNMSEIRMIINKSFTWEIAARKTYYAYIKIIEQQGLK